MKLYNYFRSSASFRVRIVLRLKNLPYDYLPLHLVRAEHLKPEFAARVGDTLLPALEIDDGLMLTQSMAIIEYLEEAYPDTARVLPADALGRSHVRALSQMVACEMHPLTNLRVLKYLRHELKLEDTQKDAWYQHWARSGIEAFARQIQLLDEERVRLGLPPSLYCWGDTPTMADACLVPQLFNSKRFAVPLDGLGRTLDIYEACMALPAFQQAQPSQSPDAEN